MKFFRNLFKKKREMWLNVPMVCKSREDKENIILDTINFLEQTIKIN
jgi:hypothetical protein